MAMNWSSGPVDQTRRDLLTLLARSAAVGVTAPALVALNEPAYAQTGACVETDITPDGLVTAASYTAGTVPVKLTVGATGATTHRIEVTSDAAAVLTVDSELIGLAKNGRFGQGRIRVRSKGVDWTMTLDGSHVPVSKSKPLPATGKLPILISSGQNVITGAFDLATWKATGLNDAPNLQTLLSKDVVSKYQPFVPSMVAAFGYAAHHSPVDLNFQRRPRIVAVTANCVITCIVAFTVAMAVCGALFPAGPVGWAVCAGVALIALKICLEAC